MRALVDIPDDQIEALAALAKRRGVSRAELIRRAIAKFTLEQNDREEIIKQAFGLWAGMKEDALDYEDRIRAEW